MNFFLKFFKNFLFFTLFLSFFSSSFSSSSSSSNLNLIRVNRNGQVESSNLGDYDLFTCKGENDDRSCEFKADSFLEYAEGLGIYFGINILATIFLIFGIPIYCIYLICSQCCCKKQKSNLQTSSTASTTTRPKRKYDKIEICRLVTSTVAVIGIPLMFLLSTLLGNYGLTSSSESLPQAANGAKSLVESLEPGISSLFISTAATVLAPTFSSLNFSINQGVNVPLVARSMQNINRTVPLLPNASHMIETLNLINYIAVDESSIPLDNLNDIVDILVDENNQLVNYLRTIDNDLNKIKSANHILLKSLYHGKLVVDDTSKVLIKLFGSDDPSNTDYTDGLVGKVESDLKNSRRSPNGLVPTTSTFQETCDSSAGSITYLISGAMNNSASSILSLTNKLTPIYSSMSSLPNYTITGQNIIQINTTIKSILSKNGLINNFQKIIPSLQNNITNYPSLRTLYQHLTAVDHLARHINITGAVSIMNTLLNIFNDIPPELEILSKELDAIRYLNVILPSLYSLTQQLIGVNSTLIQLPSTLNKIFDAYDTINNTASDVISQINSMQDSIDDSNITINGYLNTLKYHISSSEDVQDQINDSLDSYNLTYVLKQLNKTEDLMDDIDFTTIINQINNFETTLSSISLPIDLAHSLMSLQHSIESLNILLKRVVDTTHGGKTSTTKGDYLLLQQGYCSNDETKYCSTNSDCNSGSGTCVSIGSYRCTEKGSHRCFADSTCTSSVSSTSYCLADKTRAESLKTLLTLFSSSSTIPDTSTYITNLQNLQTSNTVDIESSSDSINDAIKSINSVNITDIQFSLHKVYLQIKEYNFTDAAQDIKDTINNVKDEVQDLPLQDYIDILEPFRDDFQKFLDDFYSVIVDATGVLVTLRNFLLSRDGLIERLNQFTTDNLNNVNNNYGPSEMIRTIAEQFDLLFDYFNETKLGFDSPDFSKKVGKHFLVLDRMGAYEVSGYGDMNKNGPIYYFMRLLNSSKTVLSTDRGLSGVFVNKAGDRYPGDAYCTLDTCQEHTLEVLNTAPMNQWKDEIPSFDISLLDSITYSREELSLYLWIPTLILWIIGCIAFSAHFTTTKRGEKIEKYTAGCYLACICCQLPIIMILTAIFFVLIVIIGDACDSYAPIGDNYLISYGDPFCHNVLSGNGTLTHCTFKHNLPDYLNQPNISVTVNIIEVYRAIFENECNGDGPFIEIFNSLADQIVDLPKQYTHYLINQTDDLTIRQPILDIALDGGEQFGEILSQYLKDQSVTTLTCENIANVVNNFHTDTCDSIIPPLLWIIGPWYLCAWILCCCALPSGCLLGREKKKNTVHPSEEESGSHPIVVEGVVDNDNENDDNNNNNNNEEEEDYDEENHAAKRKVKKHGQEHGYSEVETL